MGQEKGETLRSIAIFLAGRAVTGRRGHDVRVSGIGATDGAYAQEGNAFFVPSM